MTDDEQIEQAKELVDQAENRVASAEEKLDSIADTLQHMQLVNALMTYAEAMISNKARTHDMSKLEEPELSCFAHFGPLLSKCEYGSDEYKQNLKEMGTALQHHYDINPHHPEHWQDGIGDMSLFDIIEMLCDWMAATQRMKDGDIYKSIEINSKRFGIDNQLKQILINTVGRYEDVRKYREKYPDLRFIFE